MNKTFKKMISLMIALALVLAMGLTTMAATVEVKDSDDYVADRTFKAYKVFDGDYEDGKLVNLTAGDGIDWDNVDWEAIQAIGTDFGEVDSANALITALDGKDTAPDDRCRINAGLPHRPETAVIQVGTGLNRLLKAARRHGPQNILGINRSVAANKRRADTGCLFNQVLGLFKLHRILISRKPFQFFRPAHSVISDAKPHVSDLFDKLSVFIRRYP